MEFQGVQGWGGGVVTLIGGRLFGGDRGHVYTGTYTRNGDALDARLHVEQFVAGIPSVMGQTSFDLHMTGQLTGERIAASGVVPGTPMQLQATMTKRGDLPARG